MEQKLIPAIEEFLDDVEAIRLEYLTNVVAENWDEMQRLNKCNVGNIRAELEQAKREKNHIRDEYDKQHFGIYHAFVTRCDPIYEAANKRFKEKFGEYPYYPGWFEEVATAEEKKAIKQFQKQEAAEEKALKEKLGLPAALEKVKTLTAELKAQKDLEKEQKAFWKKHPELASGSIFYCEDREEAHEWCVKNSKLYRNGIRNDIHARTFPYIGEMIDMHPTGLNAKMNLNGIAIGEKGKCKVSTCVAGGYNIQCWHLRCLVHRI